MLGSSRKVWGFIRLGRKYQKNEWWNNEVKAVVEEKWCMEGSIGSKGDYEINIKF